MPSAHDLRRLAVAAICSDKTARRWFENPSRLNETSRIRLERAALELGLPLPATASGLSTPLSTDSPPPSPTSSSRAA